MNEEMMMMKMKMFGFLTTLSLSLFGAPAMAAEDPVWGPWASTDDNALAQILATNDQSNPAAVTQLGPEDSALLDVGSLLAGLLGGAGITTGSETCLGDLCVPLGGGLLNDLFQQAGIPNPLNL